MSWAEAVLRRSICATYALTAWGFYSNVHDYETQTGVHAEHLHKGVVAVVGAWKVKGRPASSHLYGGLVISAAVHQTLSHARRTPHFVCLAGLVTGSAVSVLIGDDSNHLIE